MKLNKSLTFQKKAPCLMGSLVKYTKHLWKNDSCSLKFLLENRNKKICNSFHVIKFSLILKLDKDIISKKNYRRMFHKISCKNSQKLIKLNPTAYTKELYITSK